MNKYIATFTVVVQISGENKSEAFDKYKKACEDISFHTFGGFPIEYVALEELKKERQTK